MAESYHSVAIIGAGLTGLYAGHVLRKKYPDLVLLEAQDHVGGRIKQVQGMTPWPLEAGPEFVHGSNSVFVQIARQIGANMEERDWPDWWYFKDAGLVSDKKAIKADAEVERVYELFEGVGAAERHPAPGADVNAEDWMASKGCSRRAMSIAEAAYANDFGCSLRQLGLREMIEECKGWDNGDTYLLLDRSMGFIVEHLRQGLDIRTNWPVDTIEYGPGGRGALIRCADGRRVRCRKVLITVALRVLQDGLIKFQPELPIAKVEAMQRIKMGNVMKILCTFSQQFWPKEMYDVLCPDAFVPEFWMLKYPHKNPGVGSPNCVVGFVAGERADAISAMDPQEAVRTFLEQLDSVFGTPANPRPATTTNVAAQIVDWSKNKYVRGGYTYPTVGVELGDRAELGAPVAGTLFFAGEATNVACNPCIQGAMVTAQRAADEIAAVLELEQAPLSKL